LRQSSYEALHRRHHLVPMSDRRDMGAALRVSERFAGTLRRCV